MDFIFVNDPSGLLVSVSENNEHKWPDTNGDWFGPVEECDWLPPSAEDRVYKIKDGVMY